MDFDTGDSSVAKRDIEMNSLSRKPNAHKLHHKKHVDHELITTASIALKTLIIAYIALGLGLYVEFFEPYVAIVIAFALLPSSQARFADNLVFSVLVIVIFGWITVANLFSLFILKSIDTTDQTIINTWNGCYTAFTLLYVSIWCPKVRNNLNLVVAILVTTINPLTPYDFYPKLWVTIIILQFINIIVAILFELTQRNSAREELAKLTRELVILTHRRFELLFYIKYRRDGKQELDHSFNSKPEMGDDASETNGFSKGKDNVDLVWNFKLAKVLKVRIDSLKAEMKSLHLTSFLRPTRSEYFRAKNQASIVSTTIFQCSILDVMEYLLEQGFQTELKNQPLNEKGMLHCDASEQFIPILDCLLRKKKKKPEDLELLSTANVQELKETIELEAKNLKEKEQPLIDFHVDLDNEQELKDAIPDLRLFEHTNEIKSSFTFCCYEFLERYASLADMLILPDHTKDKAPSLNKGVYIFDIVGFLKICLSLFLPALPFKFTSANAVSIFFYVIKPVLAIMIGALWFYVPALVDPEAAPLTSFFSQLFWCPMTVTIVWSDELPGAASLAFQRAAGVTLGVFFALVYAIYIPNYKWSLIVYMPPVLALAAIFIRNNNLSGMTKGFKFSFIMGIFDGISNATKNGLDINSAAGRELLISTILNRLFLSIVGCIIALLVTTVIYPISSANKLYTTFTSHINLLTTIVKSSILEPLSDLSDMSQRLLPDNTDRANNEAGTSLKEKIYSLSPPPELYDESNPNNIMTNEDSNKETSNNLSHKATKPLLKTLDKRTDYYTDDSHCIKNINSIEMTDERKHNREENVKRIQAHLATLTVINTSIISVYDTMRKVSTEPHLWLGLVDSNMATAALTDFRKIVVFLGLILRILQKHADAVQPMENSCLCIWLLIDIKVFEKFFSNIIHSLNVIKTTCGSYKFGRVIRQAPFDECYALSSSLNQLMNVYNQELLKQHIAHTKEKEDAPHESLVMIYTPHDQLVTIGDYTLAYSVRCLTTSIVSLTHRIDLLSFDSDTVKLKRD